MVEVVVAQLGGCMAACSEVLRAACSEDDMVDNLEGDSVVLMAAVREVKMAAQAGVMMPYILFCCLAHKTI